MKKKWAFGQCNTPNVHVRKWVEETAARCRPDQIHWCDGSEDEEKKLTAEAVRLRLLIPLNREKLPNCYLHRSNPNDVARVEDRTFICTPTEDEAGPTNNWMP